MAKKKEVSQKRLDELQREYDNIIVQERKLADATEQAAKSVKWYEKELKKGKATQEEVNAANKRLKKAKDKEKEFESTKAEKIKRINKEAGTSHDKDNRIKHRGYGSSKKAKEAAYQEVVNEESNSANGTKAFKNNLKAKGGGGKFGIASGIINMVSSFINAASDIYVAQQQKSLNTWMANQDVYLKTIETSSKIFQRHMKTFSKGMQGALSASFSSITQGVQEGAYAAAANSVDWSTEYLVNTLQDKLDTFRLQNFEQTTQEKAEVENLKLTGQQVNSGIGAVSGVAAMFGPLGSAIGGLATSIAQATTKMMTANAEIDFMRLQKQLEISEKEMEAFNDAETSAIEASKESVTQVLNFTKAIESLSVKTDAAAKSMANILGVGGNNVEAYEKFVFNTAANLKFKNSSGKDTYLDKDAEDLQKMQTTYVDESGRNITMGRKDYLKAFQLGTVLGDDGLAGALLGDMDYFNQTIENSTKLIYNMFQQANKAGVSNRKFARDLQQNLKLAQKYTFKGGAESLMKMSIWAQKTRFNMQDLEGIVDKIQNGSLEDVITQSAKLQVLGGNFAIGSDPLGMLYEGWNDPEALAHRFQNMTKGLGKFDKATGQVDISGPDAMFLKAYADASGIDYTSARAQVTQRIKGDQIDKSLTKSYNDQQKALLYSKAQYDTKTGKWQIGIRNRETNEIEQKGINDISGEDWNQLMPTEESIENYVAKIYSLMAQEGGVTKYAQARVSNNTFDNLKGNIDQRMADNLNFVAKSSDTLKSMVEKSNDFVTKQNKQQHDVMIATSKILDDQFELIQESTEKLRRGIEDSGSQLRLALDAVKKQLDAELAALKYGENSEKAGKANEAAATANDRLATKLKIKSGDGGGQAPSRAESAMITMTSNLTQAELKERIENYKNLKAKNGGLTLKNRSEYDDAVLSMGAGNKEILNNLYAHGKGVIHDNYTRNLTQDDIAPINEALAYLVKHEQELMKQTKDYAAQAYPSPKTTGGAGYVPALSHTYQDGFMSANGTPILSQSAKVIPIKDGASQFVQSDPRDTAIFAKSGGPFDTLFNGIFAEIRDIHNTIVPRAMQETMIERPINNTIITNYDKHVKTSNEGESMQPIRLEITGSLDLKSGGQSVDIMGELRNNPMFVRELGQLISFELSQTLNGGRGDLSLQLSGGR